ncbi:ig-like domain-containing protein [Trichonephila clavipes]|nr:ig-like domain-containing protein [Trichonephila clavipes]
MNAISVLEHFSDHDSIHQKLKKNTASVYSIAQLGRITIHRSAVSTFHDPGFFRHPLSSLPFRPFSLLSLPDPFLYIVSRSTCCQVLGGRARFNLSPQRPSAASLTLENVQKDDAGEYRCRVDFRRGRTLSWLVKLNVIVPTNSLVIKDKENKTLTGTIGPYKEGSSLTLVCEAQGEIKLADRLFTRTNGKGQRSVEPDAYEWRPPIRVDEGRESDQGVYGVSARNCEETFRSQ